MGTLYVVATPIGNLEDVTERARRLLGEVDLIAAEDTRRTGLLLKRLGIHARLISYHGFNEASRVERLLDSLNEGSVALVSDSGTPAISDPGAIFVRAAAERGHEIVPIPGPSALTAVVSASGLVSGPFIFLGFLPRSGAERKRLLGQSIDAGLPIVIFESPHRIVSTLEEIESIDPGRDAVVYREMTKLHEQSFRGTVAEAIAGISLQRTRGEFTAVIGAGAKRNPEDAAVDVELLRRLAGGLSPSAAARATSRESGIPRSEVYRRAIELDGRKNQDQGA